MVICGKRRSNGEPCQANAVAGTDACRVHAGRPLADHKARGQVVVELRSWGLHDELVDSTQAMLRLLAQAYRRAEKYGLLLGQAYEAAERLRETASPSDLTDDDLLTHQDTATDRERAFLDLQRVFTDGGVATLIGVKWGAAGKDGELYQAEEAIRGLVRLEAEERDRAFRFAKDCRAANLDERLIALAEGEGRAIAAALMGALTDLGIDAADPKVLRVVAARVEALGAAS